MKLLLLPCAEQVLEKYAVRACESDPLEDGRSVLRAVRKGDAILIRDGPATAPAAVFSISEAVTLKWRTIPQPSANGMEDEKMDEEAKSKVTQLDDEQGPRCAVRACFY